MAQMKLIDRNQFYRAKLRRSAIIVGLCISLHFAFFFLKAHAALIGWNRKCYNTNN